MDRLRNELENYLEAAGKRLVNAAADQAGAAVERLTDYTERGGGPAAEIVSGAARAITPGGGGRSCAAWWPAGCPLFPVP